MVQTERASPAALEQQRKAKRLRASETGLGARSQLDIGAVAHATVAIGETAILLHPPLPLVGVSIGMERGCQ